MAETDVSLLTVTSQVEVEQTGVELPQEQLPPQPQTPWLEQTESPHSAAEVVWQTPPMQARGR